MKLKSISSLTSLLFPTSASAGYVNNGIHFMDGRDFNHPGFLVRLFVNSIVFKFLFSMVERITLIFVNHKMSITQWDIMSRLVIIL